MPLGGCACGHSKGWPDLDGVGSQGKYHETQARSESPYVDTDGCELGTDIYCGDTVRLQRGRHADRQRDKFVRGLACAWGAAHIIRDNLR